MQSWWKMMTIPISVEANFDINKISNYNCDSLCCESHCSSKYIYFTHINVNGLDLILTFCKEHAKEYEKKLIEASKK